MKNKILDRFLKYVSFDTQSNEQSTSTPSTGSQLVFAKYLAEELQQIGLQNVGICKNGILTAHLPANTTKKIARLGFISHLDTAPGMSGKNVNPQIVNNYDGKDIVLNADKNICLSVNSFPELKKYVHQTVICTDGTTLLGADDKAGLAEIVSVMEYLMEHQDIEHGEISIAFTPDEEIGRGTDNFNVETFGADYAYTVDGGGIGDLEYENFNAAAVDIYIQGRDIHPGSAKGIMINSQLIAMQLQANLPEKERPELTEGYEGFFLLTNMEGTIDKTHLQYIVRDHDREKFEAKKQKIRSIVHRINQEYGQELVICHIRDQYYNMKEKIEPVSFLIDVACEAMKNAGVQPNIAPIRGGTDGARLSFMGLPCPNLFTGGHNFHGREEFVVLESMEKSCQTILNIIQLFAQRQIVAEKKNG